MWSILSWFTLWITLSLQIVKHPQLIQSVKHLWSIFLQSTLSCLHCETPSVISPCEEPLMSEFNLQSNDLYLTYSVCTQFTQCALSSSLQYSWLCADELSHSSVFTKTNEGLQTLTLCEMTLWVQLCLCDCLSEVLLKKLSTREQDCEDVCMYCEVAIDWMLAK